MNRREFLTSSTAMGMGAVLFSPKSLFAEGARQANRRKFPEVLEPTMNGDVKEFNLYIDIVQHEIVPGVKVHMLAFNGQVPGPEIRVQEGDKVRVIFENRTQLNHTIHWHGLYVHWRHDGVPYTTQLPTMPDHEFVYEFVARPYGTHFYHCHWGTVMHMQSGMFGPIIIEPKAGNEDPIRARFPYDRDYTFVYSAHDTNWLRNEMNHMLERMKERGYLMRNGRFDRERFGVFDDADDLRRAVEKGYEPPYVTNRRTAAELPRPNYFTINGKSYPDTPKLYIKEGENIRVRLINAGGEAHSLHMHGYDFWEVADDGIPVPAPRQMNTIQLAPGKTHDIVVEGKNRGIWTFHDHDTRRATNNGLYPGGTLTALVYEDVPEEELMAYGPYNGLRMQSGEMEGMSPGMPHGDEGHDAEDGSQGEVLREDRFGDGRVRALGMPMQMDLDGLEKLPFVALDE